MWVSWRARRLVERRSGVATLHAQGAGDTIIAAARCAPYAPIQRENVAGSSNVQAMVRMQGDPRPRNTRRFFHTTNLCQPSKLCFTDHPVGASRCRVRA
jgi:hypothetical protein